MIRICLVLAVFWSGSCLAEPDLPSNLPAHLQRRLAGKAAIQEDATEISTKWNQGARGYEKALEEQALNGADIFVWFSRQAPSDEKGLCSWFEKKGLSDIKVRQTLRSFNRVHVALPGNPENQRLADAFNVSKTPALFLVWPNGWKRRISSPFDWSSGKPDLHSGEEIARLMMSARSPSNQVEKVKN